VKGIDPRAGNVQQRVHKINLVTSKCYVYEFQSWAFLTVNAKKISLVEVEKAWKLLSLFWSSPSGIDLISELIGANQLIGINF
jgi:hypothetical protein